MRVLHTSDLHGKYKRLLAVSEPFDVWVDTGDFFDNHGRTSRTGYRIEAAFEAQWQARWWQHKELGRRIADWLGDRPLVTVAGNHDFLRLGALMRLMHPKVHEVTPDGIESLGLRWAGFREITSDLGEWAGETDDAGLAELAARTAASRPDIVLTHARPAGVLERDRENHPGVPGLLGAGARWHLFGHEHSTGGQVEVLGTTTYVNGACTLRVHELDES